MMGEETESAVEPTADEDARRKAVERLEAKQSFKTHLFVYVAVNAFLTGLWAFTTKGAFFWPIFVILGWGLGVAIHGWNVYLDKPFSEEQIRREIERGT